MSTKMTYEDIFKVLFSEQIEEYVPDGISISHPVLDMRDGHLVDVFSYTLFHGIGLNTLFQPLE